MTRAARADMTATGHAKAPMRRTSMSCRAFVGMSVLAAAFCAGAAVVQAHDDSKYPDFGGQWRRPPGIANQYNTRRARGDADAP